MVTTVFIVGSEYHAVFPIDFLFIGDIGAQFFDSQRSIGNRGDRNSTYRHTMTVASRSQTGAILKKREIILGGIR